MALFRINTKGKAPKLGGGWDILSQAIQRMWSKAPKRDVSDLPELFHKNPRLSPVAAIARAVASTPYELYNKVDYKKNKDAAIPILDHEVLDLLDMPIKRYPEIDGYFMFYTIEALTKLVGEAYLLKIRDERGKVIELDIIPPMWVTSVPSVSSPYFIVYPYGTTATRSIIVSPDDMITFRRPNLSDPYGRGRGDSEPLEQEFISDENMASMQSNFAYNDATPPYIITAPGMPQDQAEAFKKSWLQRLGGMGHRREPGILGFDAKVQTLAMSPVELDMLESRKFIRDMSSEHYQIPPEILGRIENSNRSTIDSAFYLYNRNVLSYEYGFIERVLTRQLIVTDFDKNLILKFDPDVPEDEEHKLQVFSAGLTGGVIQVDEWRKAFDLPELPGGKGKVFLRTFSTYEVPSSGPAIAPPTASPPPSEGTEDKPSDDDLIDEKPIEEASKAIVAMLQKSREIEDVKKKTIKIVSKSNNKARREAIWKAFDSRATAKEGMFIEAVQKYAKGQKPRVISALDSLNASIESGNGYDKAIDSALDSVFNDKADKALKSALAPAWLASLESGRDHLYDMVDGKKSVKAPKVNPSLEVTNLLFQKFIEEHGLEQALEINTTTYDTLRKNLQATISDGIANGRTLREISQDLMDVCDGVYENMSKARAVLISRTESAMSLNAGSFITADAEGMTQKQFLATMDDRVRDAHADADGQMVGINEPFIVGGEQMLYPGDGSLGASAGNIIQCRCSTLFGSNDIPLGEEE